METIITRHEPHCVAWALTNASLWGMSSSHDLDEPVRLSYEIPVRLRWVRHRAVADRRFSLQATRPATHIAVRFYFKDGSFHEVDLIGIPHLDSGETAMVVNDDYFSKSS